MAKVLTFVAVFLTVLSGAFALSTWLMMLFIGIIHSVWDLVPALGFWQSSLVTLGIMLLRLPNSIAKITKRKRDPEAATLSSVYSKWSNN